MFEHSHIIRYLQYFQKKFNNIFKKSIFNKNFLIIFLYFNKIYNESLILKSFENSIKFSRKFFEGSKVWNVYTRIDVFSVAIEASSVYKLLSFIINLPVNLLIAAVSKLDKFINDSKLIALLKKILRRFEIIIGISVIIIICVPDPNWYNVYSIYIVGALSLLLIIKMVIFKQDGFNIRAIDVGLLLFMLTIIFSQIFSISPNLSTRFFVFFAISFMLLIIIVSSLKTHKAIEIFIELVVIGVTFTAIYGIWQSVTHSVPFNPSYTDIETSGNLPGRIFSTMANPNNYGIVLALFLPYFFAIIFNTKSKVKQITYLTMFILNVIALVLTGSRSCWIAFCIEILIIVYFKNKKLIPLIFIFAICIYPLLPDSITKRIMSIFVGIKDTSAAYRVKIFNTVIPMMKDFWVSGIGLGTDLFNKFIKRYFIPEGMSAPLHSHITYAQILIENGIIGLLSIVWFWFRIIKKSAVNIYRNNDKAINNVLIAGVAATCGALVIGVVEYVWYYPRTMIMYWVHFAIMLSSLSILDNKKIKQ